MVDVSAAVYPPGGVPHHHALQRMRLRRASLPEKRRCLREGSLGAGVLILQSLHFAVEVACTLEFLVDGSESEVRHLIEVP